MEVGESVREEEEVVCLGELMKAGEVEGVYGEVVFVGVEDGVCEGESLLKAALGEEKFGFREEEIWIGSKVVVG